MKVQAVLALLVLHSITTLAQQDPQFSQYLDYNAYINPSFIVNDYELNADVQHRQQWVGFDGRPITTSANVSYEVKKAYSAFGVTYLHDQLGAQEGHNARLNYAGVIRFKGHTIAPGIYFGAMFTSLDGSQLNPIQTGDPNIISSKQEGNAFDMGLGLSYRYRGLVVGLSISHLTGQTISYPETITGAQSEITIARHYYGLVRYDFKIGRVFRLKPLSFVKTDAASAQFDQWLFFGADNLTKMLNRVNIGVGYRIDDAVMVSAELIFKWFRLGYSYDITTSGLRSYSKGSHEITLRMHLFKSGGPRAGTELE
ncbi:MAG: PorP/SprF family type IX secretion system membrane protein [Flavobacteriales bacterium]|nr:PorP/SprF family type IX secretion system membrane protein [Flavobacteriales bacterium]